MGDFLFPHIFINNESTREHKKNIEGRIRFI